MSLDADLKKLADAVATDWPEIAFSNQFDAAIRDLYRSHLQFPASWSQDDQDEFIENNADIDASQLGMTFDDLIDTVIERYGRQHYALPDPEDAAEMIANARKAAVYDLESYIEAYADEIAQSTNHSLNRAEGSMTGCSPIQRRLNANVRTPGHRRRRKR